MSEKTGTVEGLLASISDRLSVDQASAETVLLSMFASINERIEKIEGEIEHHSEGIESAIDSAEDHESRLDDVEGCEGLHWGEEETRHLAHDQLDDHVYEPLPEIDDHALEELPDYCLAGLDFDEIVTAAKAETVEAIRSEILPLCGAEIFEALRVELRARPELARRWQDELIGANQVEWNRHENPVELSKASDERTREILDAGGISPATACPDCADTDGEDLCELCRVEGPGWRERFLTRARYYMGPK